MSAEVYALCRRLQAAGWSLHRISQCVRLPERDIFLALN